MWVGTFHSICGRILRQDIENYSFQSGKKLDKNFTIYDETDSVAVIKQAVKKLNMDDKIYQPKLIKAVISNAKNKMQDAYTFATFAVGSSAPSQFTTVGVKIAITPAQMMENIIAQTKI